jgi:hypothetical protein
VKTGFDPSQLIQQLKAAATQDPRKAGVLGVLAVVFVVMFGRMMLTGSTAPTRAAGSMTPTAKSVSHAGSSADEMTLRASSAETDSSEADSSRAARTHNPAQQLHDWMNEPVRPLSRNLFAVKLEYFPVDGSRAPLGAKGSADGEFWGQLEKSLMLQADQRDKHENLLSNYRTEAGKLRLDSIMWGSQPKAMIDGKLVAEGDVVASFRVLKIEPRRIIVEREGIRLEIQMK